ncbi:MAG: hypothetical protein QG630_374 [Patescibacteria group bacterium]|nr:hypothetical protein [Patescibacteria group bacterium]
MLKIILLGIIGAIISMIIGMIWHSSKLFGKSQLDYNAKKVLTFEEHKNKCEESKHLVSQKYLLQFLLSFITSFFLALVMKGGYGDIHDKYLYMFVALVWISFTVPAVGTNVLWSEVPKKIALKKFLSDIFYCLITFMLIAFIFTLIL